MSDILEKVRKLNWMVQQVHAGAFTDDDICSILSELTGANVAIINNEGVVLGASLKIERGPFFLEDSETGRSRLNQEVTDRLAAFSETSANVQVKNTGIDKDGNVIHDMLYTVIPILGGGKRWGSFTMSRREPAFMNEEIAIGEYGATMVGLKMYYNMLQSENIAHREEEEVKMAIGTLSYSEGEAVKGVFRELDGMEGILVASRIADQSGITRSVIVNALRKLESAGVIETRSLGMKGTRIKILNPKLKSELKINEEQ